VVWSQETQGEMMLISLRLPRNEFLHQNQCLLFLKPTGFSWQKFIFSKTGADKK